MSRTAECSVPGNFLSPSPSLPHPPKKKTSWFRGPAQSALIPHITYARRFPLPGNEPSTSRHFPCVFYENEPGAETLPSRLDGASLPAPHHVPPYNRSLVISSGAADYTPAAGVLDGSFIVIITQEIYLNVHTPSPPPPNKNHKIHSHKARPL